VARRLRLTRGNDPRQIESDLCAVIPRSQWIKTGLRLLLHGRYICTARSPRCADCPLNEICPSRQAAPRGSWQERAAGERRVVESRRNGTVDDGEVEVLPRQRRRKSEPRGWTCDRRFHADAGG
jgi:adenine-specific DNA glycosylase